MSYVSVEDLINKTDSIYKLVVMASKRAAELNAGAPMLIEAGNSEKITTIVLEEIAQGRVKIQKEK